MENAKTCSFNFNVLIASSAAEALLSSLTLSADVSLSLLKRIKVLVRKFGGILTVSSITVVSSIKSDSVEIGLIKTE